MHVHTSFGVTTFISLKYQCWRSIKRRNTALHPKYMDGWVCASQATPKLWPPASECSVFWQNIQQKRLFLLASNQIRWSTFQLLGVSQTFSSCYKTFIHLSSFSFACLKSHLTDMKLEKCGPQYFRKRLSNQGNWNRGAHFCPWVLFHISTCIKHISRLLCLISPNFRDRVAPFNKPPDHTDSRYEASSVYRDIAACGMKLPWATVITVRSFLANWDSDYPTDHF